MRLEDYRDAVKEWQRQKRLYDGLKTLLDASGQDYSKPKVQTSPKDNMAETMAKLIERESRLNNARSKMLSIYSDIQEKITSIEDDELVSILEERYLIFDIETSPVRYREFEVIAKELKWSVPKTYRLHKIAVKRFYDAL